MKRAIAVLGVTMITVSCANAMRIAMPQACRVLNSDTVFTGKVVDVGAKKEKKLLLAANREPVKRYFQTSTVKIEEVFYTAATIDNQPEAGKTVRLTTWARKPRSGMRRVVMDGPHYANLDKGKRYLFTLNKLPKAKGFVAQPSFKNTLPINDKTKERVERMKKLADVNSWNWGKPVNGLQVAIVPDEPVRLSNELRGRLMFVAALRNTSEKQITLSLYGPDHPLKLYIGNKEAEKPVGLYANANLADEQFSHDEHTRTLASGEIVPVARHGYSRHGDHVQLSTGAGKYVLKVSYRNKRQSKRDNIKLWTGTIQSETTPIKCLAPNGENLKSNR